MHQRETLHLAASLQMSWELSFQGNLNVHHSPSFFSVKGPCMLHTCLAKFVLSRDFRIIELGLYLS